MKKFFVLQLVSLALLSISLSVSAGFEIKPNENSATAAPIIHAKTQPITMQLQSPAFQHQTEIPTQYTCEGDNVSPPLMWSQLPAGSKSLVLIVDDPDAPDPAAPKMTWVHWLLYNLPANSTGLAEAVKNLPAGVREGLNDWKKTGYGGPCPPIGRHRYFHKLYALDSVLPADLGTPNKAILEKAMQGHILATAELIGTYQKRKSGWF